MSRRSYWGWGLESDEPTEQQRIDYAKKLSERHGVTLTPPPHPTISGVSLRAPRISAPAQLAGICSTDTHDRAGHTYGKSFLDTVKAIRGVFPNPPDVVAFPRTEADIVHLLEWCDTAGNVVIPYGGGSSVVGGVEAPKNEARGIVSIDLRELNQVLEVDATSRAARIQAGALGPALDAQLKPHGFTLRHFPQSFEWSTLGGWLATRSGGHYATNHTHIDDFVESVRMLTPKGWFESRRLPGSGAGPSPDRMVIGSEGILGVITEAWMRIQARPTFRATAGIVFPTWAAGADAVRQIVQAKLWPANCRILDPEEAGRAAGLDGTQTLVIVSFESAELPQRYNIGAAVDIARSAGGLIDDDAIRVDDGKGEPTGRSGAVGAWRDAFIGVGPGLDTSLGLVADTFETAITWDQWPEFDALVRDRVGSALREVFGDTAELSCRFTHVYTDGPAPYYTWFGMGRQGSELSQWAEIKHAAGEAVCDAGGTITHHHAVGRMHRPQYDRERPDLFADALRAAKLALDPNGILNPGVLIDP